MTSAKPGSPTSVLVNDVKRYTLSMKSRGDMLYKQLFGHPEMVRDLLAAFLSAEWARSLDVGAFERVNASYVNDRGKARHDDVVWRARIGSDWIYVYILLEFQARPDEWMALRMQVYVGLLCQDLVARHCLTRGGKLPPVLPIVLYHGRAAWRASTDLANLMLAPPEGMEQFQPQQKYMLIDQHRNKIADHRSNIVSMLFGLLRSRSAPEMRTLLSSLSERMKAPEMQLVRGSIERWVRSTLQDEFRGSSMFAQTEGPAMLFNRRFKTFEELFEYEALQRGCAKGLRMAIEEMLQASMPAGGAQPPPEVAERLAAADVPQLKRWLKSLARGSRPRSLFA
ncbi:hypothetical protein JOD97_003159 [Duganella sp. 1411]|uniref:Rpn family recombination-promoting nuclease/putative transposase n=1 Tax=Duganella sp. 1411 TaxID=2806572 RepID=UPI001B5844A1|nr:Rpn family recombination-promoting nuclease/putative transposase [Duganella sp. 1411]MBP1205117.1 hypothetical protein [Duganella sp. 1411]